jgi:DNA polymerase-1
VEVLVAGAEAIQDPKLKALVLQYGSDALRFKDLATIRRDAPLDDFEFTLDYQTNGIDIPAATALFERLEFRTMIKRLGKLTPASKAANEQNPEVSPDFGRPTIGHIGSDLSTLIGVLLRFDVPLEKADFLNNELQSVSISPGISAAVSITDILPEQKSLLEDDTAKKVVHDKKLAEGALAENGITLRGVVFDTFLAAYLINPGRSSYKLSDLVTDYAGISIDDPGAVTAEHLRFLQSALAARLAESGLTELHDRIELPLASILRKIERTGVAVDVQWLKKVSASLALRIEDLEQAIYVLAGTEAFSIGSTKQLQSVLFEKLGLPAGKKTKTGYSTDSEVLDGLAVQGFEIASRITEWRELSKLKSTYADNLQLLVSKRDGRLHTSLNQTVTATGRLSSSNPNLQNIPVRTEIGREIRKAFIADPGKVLFAADYSQIELRIFAHITQDPELLRTFRADEDIHRRTASIIFGVDEETVTAEQRRRAKTINFAVIYGMSDFRLASELGIDVATANIWKKRYFSEYPGVSQFAESVLEGARENGYVQTLLGRRRYTPDIKSRVFQFRQAAEREAVNMPVQGTAADIIKLAMVDVDRALALSDLDAVMTLQVHDELVFECSPGHVTEAAAIVARCMENAYKLSVRLKVELKLGHNWSEMTKVANVLDNEQRKIG